MSALCAADVIKGVRDLPAVPIVVLDVLKSFEDPDADVSLLAQKMEKDQALAAKALRIANSSFYGLSRKVATIQQAITVLGFDSVRTLISAAAVIDMFGGCTHAAFDFKAFWRHAIGTALCAKLMAREVKLSQDFAFICGLLHDVGRLVLVTRFPDQYSAVMKYRTETDCHMIDAERHVLDVDHAMVGRALAEYWKFPSIMQRAIANHHKPERDDMGDIPALVHIAEATAHALDLTNQEDDLVPAVAEAAWESLGLQASVFRNVCRQTEAEFEEACQILTV